MTPQDHFDDAMFDFSTGDFAAAIAKLKRVLQDDPRFFDAQLALGMAFCRTGDYASAIIEGHKAEQLRPDEQLVHTNLSLFYLKAGDKQKAEQHGLKARIVSWKTPGATPDSPPADAELEMSKPSSAPRPPVKTPEMPWKKKDK